MNIGILKETLEHESRVAITPEIAKKLISANHKVHIESGAGEKSFFVDSLNLKYITYVNIIAPNIYENTYVFVLSNKYTAKL